MPSTISLDGARSLETELEPRRFVHMLARKLLHNRRRDMPASGAWGMSPAEIYLADRLDPLDTARWKPDRPEV
jgi:hypothetical protein